MFSYIRFYDDIVSFNGTNNHNIDINVTDAKPSFVFNIFRDSDEPSLNEEMDSRLMTSASYQLMTS